VQYPLPQVIRSLTSCFDLPELCCRPLTTPVDEKNVLPILVHSGLRNKTPDFENFHMSLGKFLKAVSFIVRCL